jgi:BolA family transcriptional regulator, general stress-responsive regulator
MAATRNPDKELTEPKSRLKRIEAALRSAFAPQAITVHDDSAAHAGHSGARAGGETHYSVAMTAAAFAGLSRVARQRAVMAALAEEFATGLHALALKLKAPGEG